MSTCEAIQDDHAATIVQQLLDHAGTDVAGATNHQHPCLHFWVSKYPSLVSRMEVLCPAASGIAIVGRFNPPLL